MKRNRLLLLALLSFAFAIALGPFKTRAHEPITTKVMFNKEVVRALQRSCLGCHRPGGIAMSLATYEDARPWAKAIKEELLQKRMPPWHAVKGYGEFSNAPALTQREIDLIVNWVEGGAPRGDDKDLPAGLLYSDDWPLGPPDVTLPLEEVRDLKPDADRYQGLTVATGLAADSWIRAIDLRPGNGAVVHCAWFFLEDTSTSAPGKAELRCLGTWMPGMPGMPAMPGQGTLPLPAGAARRLPAHSNIRVLIHYHGVAGATEDQSVLGLYLAKTAPLQPLQDIAFTNADAVIPANAKACRVTASTVIEGDQEAIAVRPRSHPLLVSLQATAYRPDGSEEVLIWARGYQFDWEPSYYFKRAVSLPTGTRVEVIAYFDNSEGNPKNPESPARQVKWSDTSNMPLCTLVTIGGASH